MELLICFILFVNLLFGGLWIPFALVTKSLVFLLLKIGTPVLKGTVLPSAAAWTVSG